MHRAFSPFTAGAIATILALATSAQEQSLADKAAALRHVRGSGLSPSVAGHVVDGDYHNSYFGLTIRHPSGWESLNRGEMNVREAAGRSAMGLPAGIDGDRSGRVFGMNDSLGSSVFLSIRPIPPGVDTSDLGAKLQAEIVKALPQLRCGKEPITLGDSGHRFVAFRCANPTGGQVFYQDQQAIVERDHLIALTVTAPTSEKLTTVLQQLRKGMEWRPAQ